MVHPGLTGLDYQKFLFWYGSHEENGLRNSSKVFSTFSRLLKVFKAFKIFAPCLNPIQYGLFLKHYGMGGGGIMAPLPGDSASSDHRGTR